MQIEELISVIVPVYNVEKYLAECIESLLEQTYENYEIILVNDGSTDSSGIICDKYSQMNSRISVIHKRNGGLSSARNAGIEDAKGKYLAFVDSDDVVHPDYLKHMYKLALQYQGDIVACDFIKGENCCWLDEIEYLDIRKDCNVIEKMNDRDVQVTVAWNKLYKRYFFDELKLRYKEGKIHEDMFMSPKLLDNCKVMIMTSRKLYFYRQRENSIMTSKFSSKQLDILEAIEYRMEYFKKRGYIELYCIEQERYGRKILYLLKKINNTKEKQFNMIQAELRNKIKLIIKNKEVYSKLSWKMKIKLKLAINFFILI